MKKIIVSAFLYSSSVFASCTNHNYRGFESNWTGTFELPDGRIVHHTPENVTIVSNAKLRSTHCLNLFHKGYDPTKPLKICVHSTRTEFKNKLHQAGYRKD